MHVTQIAAEAAPYAKTGGLGDMVMSLSRALTRRGHHVDLVLPCYRSVRESGVAVESAGAPVTFGIAGETVHASILKIAGSESTGGPRVFFVDHPCFDRDGIYGTPDQSYGDNAWRYTVLQRAALADLDRRGDSVDLVHAHDWQTSLVPLYLKTLHRRRPCLLTVHNLAHQGRFPIGDFGLSGLPPRHLHWRELEFHGDVNWLKGGIIHADQVTTVSPTYAREIRTAEYGCGLEGVLNERSDALTGIVNGIDDEVWDPSADPLIPHPFDADDLSGKAACKRALQKELGLAEDADVPLIGLVARLASQKGIDLVLDSLHEWIDRPVQVVMLGVGEERFENALTELARRLPDKVSVNLAFDDGLAHLIEAGSDFFLMPSRFEPCGLNQLYSLRYGTVPIVRRTGGLADTVIQYNLNDADDVLDTANGFAFNEPSATALAGTILEALRVYRDEPETMSRLIANGMARDSSWDQSAQQYEELYETIVDAVGARETTT